MPTWASAFAIWSLLFGSMHFFWLGAYFAWPAAGRAMLGPIFEPAFASLRFRTYDLVVGVLFVAVGLAAGTLRRGSTSKHETFVRRSLRLAVVLLSVRGTAGTLLDTLIILGVIQGSISRMMFYDLWFLVGAGLGAGALHQQRHQVRSVGV